MKALKDFTWSIDGKIKSFKKGGIVDLPEKELKKAIDKKLVEEKENKKD